MRKIIISILVVLSLFFSSCATSIKVQGIELNSEIKAEADNNEIAAYATIVTICGVLYVVIPIIAYENLKDK